MTPVRASIRIGLLLILSCTGFAGGAEQQDTAHAAEPTGEDARQGWLGFGFHYNEEESGESSDVRGWLYVHGMAPDSPGEKGGLRVGDLITEVNGQSFRYEGDVELLDFFKAIREGQEIVFTVLRGQEKTTVALTAAPMTPELLAIWQRNYRIAKEKSSSDG